MIAPPKDSMASKPKKTAEKAQFSAARLVVWGVVLLLALAAAFAYFAFFAAKNHPAPSATEKPKAPQVAKPAQKKAAPKKAEPKKPEKPVRFWEVDAAHTNGFTEMQMRKWRKEHLPPPGYTNNAVLTRPKPKYAIFNHSCDNLIAAYLTLTPGEGLVGTPILGERFLASFAVPGVKAGQRNTTAGEIEAALARRIPAGPSDGLETRQIKAMVEGMKQEARAYLAAGGSIVGYGARLTERQDAEIAAYERAKANLERAKETMRGKALIDYWESQNDKLRNLGIRPITFESLE